MTKKELEILTNIIGAVESGGQIYGQRRYEAYAAKGQNSALEKTCTLGWAQNYGLEARKLCRMIYERDPAAFKNADTANIEARLAEDWVARGWDPSSKEKAALIAIITTDAGKACQDELFASLMEIYEKSAISAGVTSAPAIMMWCEIEHLGGVKSAKRIFKRAEQPYTPDSVFASLLLDQADTSNNNQVGDKMYQTRHECCVRWIKRYVTGEDKEDETMGRTAQDFVNAMAAWVGYSEANGKFKAIIDLYNSVKPLPRGYAVQYSDEWCDTTVSAASIKAGTTDLTGRECGCEEHVKIFKSLGIWEEDGTITPKPGHIILYNWDKATQPNDGYSDHIGVVESVGGGMITVIEGNKGEAVARRVLSIGNGYIRGYAHPNFATGSGSTPAVTAPTGQNTIGKTVLWTGTVNTAELCVRTWAGTEFNQLKSYPTIKQGTQVGVCETINDKSGSPWYFVKISGAQGEKYGFVSAAYITKAGASAPTDLVDDGVIDKTPKFVGKVTADKLNVRTWAGTNNPTIKSWPQLGGGNLVDVCDVVNAADGSRWYYVRIDGRIYGFVHSAYITEA